MDGVHHRKLPGDFSADLGSGIGHSSQVNHQMMAASQAGSRGEVKGGVGSCGRFRRVRSGLRGAPLLCLMQPCSDVRAPQLFHMDCTIQLATCAARCVRAQHALGSVCPAPAGAPSLRRCASGACVHAQHAPIWINTVYKLFSLVVLQR